MSPAYFDTGFSVREPMWHGLGMVLDEYPTDWADARTKAGLTWEPEERPAFIKRAASTFTLCRHCEQMIGERHDVECPVVATGHLVAADRVHENVEKARATWRWLYGESPTTEGIRGTGFGILQTSTEYLDHARAFRSKDSYLGRSILRTEPAKGRALQIIRSL